MNPTSADPTAPPPPPPRSSFSCDRHPHEKYAGFCPSCLCERLSSLDHSSSNTPSSSCRPSSASASTAVKSLFSSTSKINDPPAPLLPKPSKTISFFPELRRTQSFSASKNEALGLIFEPQRKSCDVRVRNTLWALFTIEDENKTSLKPSTSASSSNPTNLNIQKIEIGTCAVLEETKNEDDFHDLENIDDGIAVAEYDGVDEIRHLQDSHIEDLGNVVEVEANSATIVEEEAVKTNILKPMKDHMNISNQEKKSSGGGFWAAASVFSKKLQKWRQKQKVKKQSNGQNMVSLPVEKPMLRQFRETQSEIADYGFGRRSCDTDPRFSLDAGRISFDDPRYSFDEPRASWDGYFIGRTFPRMAPMLSVLEDAPAVNVMRSDMQIPVEERMTNCTDSDKGDVVPGGSEQTREYYTDSSSKRRKSLDRSSSIRKTAAAVVAEIDELKMVSNAKVSPTTADYFHRTKVFVGERDLRDSNSNSLRDDYSETLESGSGFRDSSNSVISNGEGKESKKSRRWRSWRIWGFMYRRNGSNKYDDGNDKNTRLNGNGVERSLSESWKDTRNEGNRHNRDGSNRTMFRSNSSVSWRNANQIGGSLGNAKKLGVNVNENGRKKRDEFVLERNRSARYSPSHIDNGLLRFYLTPVRGSRRVGLGKVSSNNSHSIRNVLRLY